MAKLMAIGDSLYQGVRSLTINAGLCQGSAPAQIARALNVEFEVPDPARPILVDMEAWLRNPNLGAISQGLGTNAAYWLAAPQSPSGKTSFDNVAIAGSEVWHLYAYTAADARASADTIMAQLGGSPLSLANIARINLGELFYAFNARFTLNPSNAVEHENKTQMDWVAAKMPKRLLINIGSNNGLWNMCFNALPTAQFYFGRSYGRNAGLAKDYGDFTQIEELGYALDRLPKDVEEIYFNGLARPRCVGNLMPIGQTGDNSYDDYLQWYHQPGLGYFDTYENRFALARDAYGRISGQQMAAMDEYVRGINSKIEDILRGIVTSYGRKLIFVNMFDVLSANDAKHYGDKAAFFADGKRMSNNMYESTLLGGFRSGGLFGLDGMHLTTLGYGLMANAVLDRIDPNSPKVALDPLAQRDGLIQRPPGMWTPLMFLWRDIRRASSPKAKSDMAADDAKISLIEVASLAGVGAGSVYRGSPM